jgi:hypothetical protein
LKIPPESPPPRIILVARRPQNRSGIRSALTRSDLVLGRLLVQPFKASHFLFIKHYIGQIRSLKSPDLKGAKNQKL